MLLRPEVLELVEAIAEQDNLSNSKVVALLAEEALVNRGLFQKNQIQPTTSKKRASSKLEDSVLDMAADKNLEVTAVSKRTEDLNPEDLALLKKIKLLKEMNLL